ncbi:MAG: DUF3089 domain-containing protein [Sedimentisphaeraceae bacterium JB056]
MKFSTIVILALQRGSSIGKRIALLTLLLPVFVLAEDIDYSDADNWLKLPTSYDKPVDVFYVYPTVSADPSGYMDINNETDRGLALGIYKSQASIFFGLANIVAPYYRQCSTGGQTYDYSIGQADVDDAFNYYLTNINPGLTRPFILAGHSQGTRALKVLIMNNFPSNQALSQNMIAAYLLGETITEADLAGTGLTAAQGESDTKAVVTFNTQAPGVDHGPMVSSNDAICINPLNWKTDDTYASSEMHLGAVIYDHATGEMLTTDSYPYLNFCDAQIDTVQRGLTANIPEEYKTSLDFGDNFGEGVYHRYDYDFWYRNLQNNVVTRIIAYGIDVPCIYKHAADLNGDCKVNMLDLAEISKSWLLNCNESPELCN